MPKVFMLMPHNVDVSKARRFGELIYIFDRGARRPSLWSPEFIDEMFVQLAEMGYDPATDYLLIAGNMAPIVRAACALARDCDVPPRALFYDAVTADYVELPLGIAERAVREK